MVKELATLDALAKDFMQAVCLLYFSLLSELRDKMREECHVVQVEPLACFPRVIDEVRLCQVLQVIDLPDVLHGDAEVVVLPGAVLEQESFVVDAVLVQAGVRKDVGREVRRPLAFLHQVHDDVRLEVLCPVLAILPVVLYIEGLGLDAQPAVERLQVSPLAKYKASGCMLRSMFML